MPEDEKHQTFQSLNPRGKEVQTEIGTGILVDPRNPHFRPGTVFYPIKNKGKAPEVR